MAASAYTDTVQKVYIAYYGRAADPVGLAYWSSAIDTAGGSLAAIMANFGASAEATTLYGSLTSNTAKVNALYQQSFGRDADFAGLMYYAGQLSAGTMTAVSIAQNIFDGASGTDATMLTNKLVVAKAYTAAIDTAAEVVAYSGTVAAASARTLLSTVDATTTTTGFDVATSIASIVTVSNTAAAVAGGTFTLTTSVDTMTGNAGDDSFTADNTGTTATSSTADVVTGGAGNDTLSIFSSGTAALIPKITGVETVGLYDHNANFDISSKTDVTKVDVNRGEGDSTITVAAGVTVNLVDVVVGTGNGAAATTVAYKATDTTAVLGLSGVTAKGTDGNEDVSVTGAALTSITINATTTANAFDSLNVAAIPAVTINSDVKFTAPIETVGTTGSLTLTGAGKFSIGTIDAGFDTVTATANTGGVTLVLDSGTDTIVNLGSGADTVSTDATMATSATLAVNAGAGVDKLIVTDDADLNVATEGARYTNFETLNYTEGGSAANIDMSLISGITKLESGVNTSASFTNVSVAQSGNITVTGDQTTDLSVTLLSATGTADSVTFNMKSATTTANVDAIFGVDNIETVNFVATTGTNSTNANAVSFLGSNADEVTAINISGTADFDLTAGASGSLDAVAVDISAAGLTGTGDFSMIGGILLTGSTVTGSLNADAIALSTTTGTTYDGGLGNDTFTSAIADIVATGSNDNVLNGGAGTDKLTLSNTTGVTLTDNHYTWMSNMEALTLTATGAGSVSLTMGSAFNSAFSDGVTLLTGAIADAQDVALSAGLATMAMTVTIEADLAVLDAAGEDMIITTGSGADVISYEGAALAGKGSAADGGSLAITSGAGDDTITVTTSTLVQQTISQLVTITAGTGADTITKTSTNAAYIASVTDFIYLDGDSTVAARDKITGFNMANTTFSDVLDFENTGAVATSATSNDSGTILSHAFTNGIMTFDDAAAFGSAVTITSSNLADVTGYLQANVTTAGQTVGFTYDSDNSGTADATFVFNAGTGSSTSADSLVELVGVVATSLNATLTTTTASTIGIA